jgi:hypothetical protein
MKTIITTYPDYQSLPAGIKKMLVASEDFFFREAQLSAAKIRRTGLGQSAAAGGRFHRQRAGDWPPFGEGWRN